MNARRPVTRLHVYCAPEACLPSSARSAGLSMCHRFSLQTPFMQDECARTRASDSHWPEMFIKSLASKRDPGFMEPCTQVSWRFFPGKILRACSRILPCLGGPVTKWQQGTPGRFGNGVHKVTLTYMVYVYMYIYIYIRMYVLRTSHLKGPPWKISGNPLKGAHVYVVISDHVLF